MAAPLRPICHLNAKRSLHGSPAPHTHAYTHTICCRVLTLCTCTRNCMSFMRCAGLRVSGSCQPRPIISTSDSATPIPTQGSVKVAVLHQAKHRTWHSQGCYTYGRTAHVSHWGPLSKSSQLVTYATSSLCVHRQPQPARTAATMLPLPLAVLRLNSTT